MPKCSHYVALEEKCPLCVAEGLAREAALQLANRSNNNPSVNQESGRGDQRQVLIVPFKSPL
jgi:hypothetical protein